ncbi:hypothetical protein LB542_26145 [Mesorhizobium sp. BR1-1-9]|uniref:hypothetical protein n=1 Tax=unclassified Mesorhizobium TaxID=325217 RepID=UPI0011287782|nr:MULTISPECIES: hypothetical protein [unclassified Mesorhizobium]MBZ9807285.1 hypothetical protein [Mesorhizobium sp. ESP-6-2]MBZ9874323.1 hypothetical protein [Mesorhizobium sp. BR1-1-9]MBZ9943385.1 hypothetical protein [Mesorhizobium sp. BR1-1-13]TPM25177.1 hypothetical protein FJ955_23910 [Mesorhizobium sp. B2-2-2]
MKKIVLTVASLLFASGMAFAGSDHFGSDFIPAASSYPTTHAMMSGGAKAAVPSVTNSIADSAMGANSNSDMPAQDYGQGIWGR